MTENNNWENETDFEIVAITGEHDPEGGEVKETDIEITKNIECNDEPDERIVCMQNTPDKIKTPILKAPKKFLPKWSDQLKFLKIQDNGINKTSEASLVALYN
jgi:hypothetical protein